MDPVLRLAGGGIDDGDGLAGGGAAPLPVGVVPVHLAVQDLREHPRPRQRHGYLPTPVERARGTCGASRRTVRVVEYSRCGSCGSGGEGLRREGVVAGAGVMGARVAERRAGDGVK